MLGKFCAVPKNQPNVCPNVGWIKDFYDAQTLLDATFNPVNVLPENNSNFPKLEDKKLEQAFEEAEVLTEPAQRARAYAQINKMITAQGPGGPLCLGQAGRSPVRGRRRRDQRLERALRPVVHVDQQQAAAAGSAPMLAYIVRRLLWMIVPCSRSP